jgi:multiple sugar transport system substrate-binding protein
MIAMVQSVITGDAKPEDALKKADEELKKLN